MIQSEQGKKSLNFELNLVPVFDILSCCICFLMMTVAWIQIGSLSVNQAMGSQGASNADHQPALWATLNSGGEVILSLKNAHVEHWSGESIIQGQKNDGSIRWNLVSQRIQAIHNALPELTTAFVLPSQSSVYQDIVHMMDVLRQTGVTGIGISPL